MNKTSKIIIIIGVLCMLVPFMVLGTFASAETNSIVKNDVTSNFRFGYVSNVYNTPIWNGGLDFVLTFPSYENYVLDNPFNGVSSMSFSFAPLLSNSSDTSTMTFSDLSGLRFPSTSVTSRNISFTITGDVLHTVVFAFNYKGVLADVNSIRSSLALNDIPLSGMSHGFFNIVIPTLVWRPSPDYLCYVGSGSVGYGDDTSPSYFYEFRFYGGTAEDTTIADTNTICLVAFSLGRGEYSLRATGNMSSSCYLLGAFDTFITGFDYSNGFTNGYNDGFDVGVNQGYNDGYSAGVIAGKEQANSTVNTGSASYIQGYQDGLGAPEYSFLSLISSIIDAPIRAFFGYTEDGVTHPGLFNFNILGYDMSNLVLSIFSLCVLLTILRLILGGK